MLPRRHLWTRPSRDQDAVFTALHPKSAQRTLAFSAANAILSKERTGFSGEFAMPLMNGHRG
jgi:hypothetical protein